MILIFATPEEARELLGLSTRQTKILRPQTSGPCVHYDERSEHAADADPCTYPYSDEHSDGVCPHLDNPDIICPVKDACCAMHEAARMRGVCGAEQVSGQCVYYDERSEHEGDVEQCTYPYEGGCPHLDDEVFCPVKDEWLAESERIEQDLAWAWGDDLPEFVSLAQDPEGRGHDLAAEATDTAPRSDYVLAPRDPQEQVADAEEPEPEFPALEPDDGALHTYTVPATRKPTNPNAWSDEEEEVIRRARNAKEAVTLYYGAYPQSSRTYAAVQSRWYRLRAAGELIEPEPEEPVFVVSHPTYRPGDRVRITHALHRGQTGKIERYSPATENYLVAIDGMPDMIVLTDAQMEAV